MAVTFLTNKDKDVIEAEIGQLSEDIDNKMPTIEEDGESVLLLDQSDIDDTLSVDGKVADAGAVGEMLRDIVKKTPDVEEDPATVYILEQLDIDNTLSVDGKVADAGAVGKEIGSLSEEIEAITEQGESAYVQLDGVVKHPDMRWYINGTGPVSGSGKTAIEFACKPNATYDICGKYAGEAEAFPIIIMDADNVVLQTITDAVQVTVEGKDRHTIFTTPDNAALVRYNVSTNADFDSQREKTASVYPRGVPDLQKRVDELEETVADLADGAAEQAAAVQNLRDGMDTLSTNMDSVSEQVISGYEQITDVTKYTDMRWYINGTGPTAGTGKTAIEFACKPNTTYDICGKYAGEAEAFPIIIMDAEYEVLQTITDAVQTMVEGQLRHTIITTPDNAAIVRYNVSTDAEFDSQRVAVKTLIPRGVKSKQENTLYDKKWVPFGDSFTYFTDAKFESGPYKNMNRVYPRIIAERNAMRLVDTFFNNGRTLAFPENPGDFTNSVTCPTAPCYYQNVPEDVDYITIYLGINDGHHAVGDSGSDGEDVTGIIPIGTIDDANTSTYYGAWNVVLPWLMEHRPFAHIGIIVSNGCDTEEYRAAQLAIAKKYGVPYIDLNGDERTPVMIRSRNADIDQHVRDMVTRKQAVDYDGTITGSVNTHPNAAAHEYESYFIESFLRTI